MHKKSKTNGLKNGIKNELYKEKVTTPYLYDYMVEQVVSDPKKAIEVIKQDLQKYNISLKTYESKVENRETDIWDLHNTTFLYLFFDEGLKKINDFISKANIAIRLKRAGNPFMTNKNFSNTIGSIFEIDMPDIFYLIIKHRNNIGYFYRVSKDKYNFVADYNTFFADIKVIPNIISDNIRADLRLFAFRRDLTDIHEKFKHMMHLAKIIKYPENIDESYKQFCKKNNINSTKINTIINKELYLYNLSSDMIGRMAKINVESAFKMEFKINRTLLNVKNKTFRNRYESGYLIKTKIEFEQNRPGYAILNITISGPYCTLMYDENNKLIIKKSQSTDELLKMFDNINKKTIKKALTSIERINISQ